MLFFSDPLSLSFVLFSYLTSFFSLLHFFFLHFISLLCSSLSCALLFIALSLLFSCPSYPTSLSLSYSSSYCLSLSLSCTLFSFWPFSLSLVLLSFLPYLSLSYTLLPTVSLSRARSFPFWPFSLSCALFPTSYLLCSSPSFFLFCIFLHPPSLLCSSLSPCNPLFCLFSHPPSF